MFVDASGDDGYKFKETSNAGSSYSFVVSCFVTTPDELEYNKSVLLNMKHALSVKPEQEIKSTSLKRHKYATRAYACMQELHGFAYSLIADKRLIQNTPIKIENEFSILTQIAKNDLSGITHTFPYFSLTSSDILAPDDKVLIVIDNMKKREKESIKSFLSGSSFKKYHLIFRDSKDKDFSLIQIADIMAGTIRVYYENCLPVSKHNRFCKNCVDIAIQTDRKLSKAMFSCRNKKYQKLYNPYITDSKFNIVMSFHQHPQSDTELGPHFIVLPTYQTFYFMYISCLLFKRPVK